MQMGKLHVGVANRLIVRRVRAFGFLSHTGIVIADLLGQFHRGTFPACVAAETSALRESQRICGLQATIRHAMPA
jgi:hypothetical protein